MLQSHTKAVLIMGTKWSLGGRRVMTRCSPWASRKLVLTQPWATDRRVCNKQLAVRVQHWRIRYFLTVHLRKVSQKEYIECKGEIQKTKRKKKTWQKYSWQKYRVCKVGKGWDIVAWQISIFAHQMGLMKRFMRCWKLRRTAPFSPWCPLSTMATGVGPDPTGGILSTMLTPAVRS